MCDPIGEGGGETRGPPTAPSYGRTHLGQAAPLQRAPRPAPGGDGHTRCFQEEEPHTQLEGPCPEGLQPRPPGPCRAACGAQRTPSASPGPGLRPTSPLHGMPRCHAWEHAVRTDRELGLPAFVDAWPHTVPWDSMLRHASASPRGPATLPNTDGTPEGPRPASRHVTLSSGTAEILAEPRDFQTHVKTTKHARSVSPAVRPEPAARPRPASPGCRPPAPPAPGRAHRR